MCRIATSRYPASVASAGAARAWVRGRLDRWELTPLVDLATLLTSELVANAVVHAGSEAVVALAVADGVLEVSVADTGAPLPPTRAASHPQTAFPPSTALAEHGRGLQFVDALADRWSVTQRDDGKQLWFHLDLSRLRDPGPGWPYEAGCVCEHEGPDAVRLASGRPARAVPGPWDDAVPA